MAAQANDSSHRDDGMTAGGPGAESQSTPPSSRGSGPENANNSGDTSDPSASDSGNTSAQQAQTPVADSSQPANTQQSSSNDGQDTASASGNDPAPATANSDGSASSGNGDASASATNSGGSASAADGNSSAGGGSSGSSAGSGDGGNSATADNNDGSAGAGSGEHSALHLAGADGLLQPVFDTANGAASDVTAGLLHGLVDVADTVGIGAIGATPSTDGHSNLVTDLVNLPGDAVGGDLNPDLSHIFADLSDTANAATGMVGDVLGGNTVGLASNAASDVSGLLHPATDLIGSASSELQAAPLASFNGGGLLSGSVGNPAAPSSGDAVQVDTSLVGTNSPNGVLTVNGGNNAGDGGVAGAGIGDLNGSSSGQLVNLDAGPHSDHDASVGVLTAQPDSGHAATASAVDVGPGGPQLVDAGVLTDTGALNIASLNGAGTDSLAGNPLGVSTAATGAGALQPEPVATNLGEVQDVVAVPIGQDHGILDVNHTHII
jgi:hypothetical protein